MIYTPNAIITINSQELQVSVKIAEIFGGNTTELIETVNIKISLVGNSVLPTFLPSFITSGSKGLMTVDGVIGGTTDNTKIVGEFVFVYVIRSRFKYAEPILGQKFTGVLLPQKEYDPTDWS